MNTPRWLVSIIVLTALMTASIVVPASPVSADPIDGTCYGRDGFAFQHTWDEDYIYYIRVFKDGPDEDEEVDCNDTLILSASASATSDDNEVLIKV